MAFTASLISCSSDAMDSEMWNLYSGTHPGLNDKYMDPPDKIMIHPDDHSPDYTPEKDKDAFNVYYGSIIENPYTTSAFMEVEKDCWKLSEQIVQVQCGDIKYTKSEKSSSHRHQSKHHLVVPQWREHPKMSSNGLRRNKSDSDISDLDTEDKKCSRSRILSDGTEPNTSKQCVCKCNCGVQADSGLELPQKKRHCSKSNCKSRHKSRSLRNLIHHILS